jgi:cell division transport system permease protein
MASTKRKNISRRVRFSYFTSTVSMTLVLFLLGAVGFIMTNLFVTANRMRESITMIVELNDGLSEEQRNFVAERIAESDLVLSMRFVSKEEKAEDEEFKRIFAIDINSVLGVNPLPDSYDVTLSKLSSNKEALSKFAEELRQVEGISFVSYPQTFIEEMHSTLDLLQLILAIFAGVLLIVSFILLNNTIRLTVYSRRELINTLKAVGATKWFIMRPFLGRSVLQGLLAGIFAAALLGGALYGLNYLAPGFGLFPKWERLAILGGSIVAMGIIVATLCTIPIVSRFVNMRSNKIHLC